MEAAYLMPWPQIIGLIFLGFVAGAMCIYTFYGLG